MKSQDLLVVNYQVISEIAPLEQKVFNEVCFPYNDSAF